MPEATTVVEEDGDNFLAPGTLVCVAFNPRPMESMRFLLPHHKLL
jgi:hypothetical protein